MELITQDYFIIETVETQRPRESCKRNYVELAFIQMTCIITFVRWMFL